MKNLIKWFIPIITLILLYLGSLIYITYPITSLSIEKAGQLGDSFGLLNSLFSGLAFVALVITIYLQQKDMNDSKKEVQKQNFENIFFKMVDLYNDVMRNLSLERPKEVVDTYPDGNDKYEPTNFTVANTKLYIGEKDYFGKEVVPQLLKIFMIYKKIIDKPQNKIKPEIGIYEDFHKSYEDVIGHYFGTIYQILKYVDNSTIDKKEDYINIFRAQFSKAELELLFYHATSEVAKRKFTPLLIKYEFFEHINIEKLDKRAISIITEKTKELNGEYELNKAFGKNIKSKEKIYETTN